MGKKTLRSQLTPRIAVVCAVLSGIFITHQPLLAAVDSLRTVALSGDEAPGSGPGVSIDYVNPVFPLGDGRVGFGGGLRGPGIVMTAPGRNDYAIWSESNAGLRMVVQRGDEAPGAGPGDVFGLRLNPISPEQAGTSAIWADFVGSANNHGIWHRSLDGGFELVALSGGLAPGIPDENIRIVRLQDSRPVANGRNQVGFAGQYFGPGAVPGFNYGLWIREADGVIRLVARSGDAVPGKPANFVVDGGFQHLHLSDSGRFVSIGSLRQYDSPERDGEFERLKALLSETGVGTLAVVALQGQQAPGVEEGTAFQRFSSGRLALNGLGKMAFVADLTNGGQGLWTDRKGDGLTQIARRGDNAPGLDSDQHLFGLGGVLTINDLNDIAFSANFTTGDGTYESGVWMERHGVLQMIARTGDHLPGLPADTAFDFGWILRPSDRPVALLSAQLIGPAIDATNDRGLWARSATGELQLIARQGELLNVSDDPNAPDIRRIRTRMALG